MFFICSCSRLVYFYVIFFIKIFIIWFLLVFFYLFFFYYLFFHLKCFCYRTLLYTMISISHKSFHYIFPCLEFLYFFGLFMLVIYYLFSEVYF